MWDRLAYNFNLETGSGYKPKGDKPLSFARRSIPIGRFLLFTVYCLLFTVFASCSSPKDSIYRKTKIEMDTLVTITVVSDSEEKAAKAIGKAFGEIERLGLLLDFFSGMSELSAINRSAGADRVKVSPETLEVIEEGIVASEKTGGAFDATIGAESSLWDFSKKKKPGDETIRSRLGLVNYRWITIAKAESGVGLKKKGMLMDLGAIAKGFAADKAVGELKKAGIKAGLVAVAGDIRAFGLKPDGGPWKVGIRNPRQQGKDDEILATIALRDMAVSTSGDYERYFFLDGKRYHHILDPKTGYPAMGCRSVTVIAPNATSTDSFSTAVFILGPQKGMEVLEHAGFEGMIVDSRGKVLLTPGLKDRIEFQRND